MDDQPELQEEMDYPQDKVELLERIQREWSALLQAVESLSPEQLNAPGPGGWSIKDNLAHLTAWEQFMHRCYLSGEPAHAAMQVDEETMGGLDEDGLNALLYQRNRARPLEEVLSELRQSHAQVLATIEQTPFADLMKPLHPDDPEQTPVLAWVTGNTYEHYLHHRQDIQSISGK